MMDKALPVMHREAEARSAVAKLTRRQRQVLHGIVQGGSNEQIARILRISSRTVNLHRHAMMDRLKVRTTADAVRVGIYAGMNLDAGQTSTEHLWDAVSNE